MENATKALLIAAAILIAIVLISLGVWVLSTGQAAAEEAGDMTAEQVMSFNSKFSPYLGNNVMGSNVRALITKTNTNNKAEGTNGRIVTIKYGTGAITDASTIKTGQAYDVSVTAETNAGLITEITITDTK